MAHLLPLKGSSASPWLVLRWCQGQGSCALEGNLTLVGRDRVPPGLTASSRLGRVQPLCGSLKCPGCTVSLCACPQEECQSVLGNLRKQPGHLGPGVSDQ